MQDLPLTQTSDTIISLPSLTPKPSRLNSLPGLASRDDLSKNLKLFMSKNVFLKTNTRENKKKKTIV